MQLSPILAAATIALAGADAAHAGDPAEFTVLIESIAGPAALGLPDGTRIRAPISPGLYAVSPEAVLFGPGAVASAGLERLAEDGDPGPLISEASGWGAQPFLHDQPFTITASPGDRLHFAVMFVQSNDLFYAPVPEGIDLFSPDGRPVQGDLTTRVRLWDAGTEVNQAPGVGPDQAPRQSGPDTGLEEHGLIRAVDDGFDYPTPGNVIRVTIEPAATTATTN
jgi:hypothetical protein